jgi:hypothetical protein
MTLITALVISFFIPGLNDDGAEQAMSDDHRAAIKQALRVRREKQAHESMCLRMYGPQVAPAFDVDDNMICIGAHGQKYKIAEVTP